MPRQGNDDLFRLIKSLDKSEKAYFKKFAGRHVIGEKNNYLRLFDAIDRQETYDEKKLLREEKYITQLPYLKNYLTDMLLKAMQVYHAGATVENEIHALVGQVSFLYRKGMYEACEKLIRKGKKMCDLHGNAVFKVKLLYFEGNLLIHNSKIFREKKFPEIDAEILRLLEGEQNIIRYLNLQSRLFFASQAEESARTKTLDLIMRDPLLQDEKKALTFVSRSVFFNIRQMYCMLTGDFEGVYNYSKKHIALRKEEFQREQNVGKYIKALNNFFMACFNVNRFKECENILREVRTLPMKTLDDEVMVQSRYIYLLLALRLKTGEFEKGAAFAGEMESRFRKIGALMDPRYKAGILHQLFLVYFSAGNHKKSLYWLNELLTDEARNALPGLHVRALLMQVMLHYEMAGLELIPHLLRALKRQLGEKSKDNLPEHLLLECFHGIVVKGLDERTEMARAKEKLDAAFPGAVYKEHVLNDFDFAAWLESRMEKRPLAEVVRRGLRDNSSRQQ